MISKNKIKFIQSLAKKKERDLSGLFIAEGSKLIDELIKANFIFNTILTTDQINNFTEVRDCELISISEIEMKKISLLKNPTSTLAIVKQPITPTHEECLPPDIIIALDNIQDPGNMGTIIRLASWFGISTIVCSDDCVDCFNPKVIQASMGAIAHVEILYFNLSDFLRSAQKQNRTIYGTFLEGNNIYSSQLTNNPIIVFGNEGKGISQNIEKLISHKIVIPSFKNKKNNVESLNVSLAAAIVCSEFRRRLA